MCEYLNETRMCATARESFGLTLCLAGSNASEHGSPAANPLKRLKIDSRAKFLASRISLKRKPSTGEYSAATIVANATPLPITEDDEQKWRDDLEKCAVSNNQTF